MLPKEAETMLSNFRAAYDRPPFCEQPAPSRPVKGTERTAKRSADSLRYSKSTLTSFLCRRL